MSVTQPLVSVVIPTRNRPELVKRAVLSALAQSWATIEIIVVVDGRDEETIASLGSLHDSRLQVLALSESVGGAEARNVGIRAAHGNWVALLDDDDEWLPEKITSQMALARKIAREPLFIGSRFIERSERGDRILPRVDIGDGRHISEVLFCRDSPTSGTGYVQTSTWLISRDLLLEVPFTKGLKRNQDADWMIHALSRPQVAFGVVFDPLVIFHDQETADRVSQKADWRFHYEWALANRQFFTRKALAFFLLTSAVQDAAAMNESPSVILFLLKESFRLGTPTPKSLFFFLYYWLVPYKHLRRIRSRIAGVCA